MDDEQKIKTSTIICCGRQYLIKHKNKNPNQDVKLGYFSLGYFLSKKIYEKIYNSIGNFIEKYHLEDSLAFLGIFHVFAIFLTAVFLMIGLMSSIMDFNNSAVKCKNEGYNCKIFADNCLKDDIVNIDKETKNIQILNIRSVMSCIKNNMSFSELFFKQESKILLLIFDIYYYIMILFGIYFILFFSVIIIKKLFIKTKQKIDQTITNNILEVEEV
jgi:hypothetical protein